MRVVLHYGVVRAVFADASESEEYLKQFFSNIPSSEIQFIKVIDVEPERYPNAYNLALQNIQNDEIYTLVDISKYLPKSESHEASDEEVFELVEQEERTTRRRRRKAEEEEEE